MPKYTPSFIDYGAVAKVYSDELYRQAQLNAKRNDALDKHFDTEYKMYSGKVRKQDLAEFDSSFAGYQMAAKGYQRANKSTGRNISEASTEVQSARNNMIGYIQDSAQLGEYGKNLNKYRTEAKNLVDRDQLDKVLMDASTMTTSQFKETYGDSSKWLSADKFAWKPEKFDEPKLHKSIKETLFFRPPTASNMIDAVDENGQRKMMDFSFDVDGVQKTYKVPVKIVTTNPNPDEVLQNVTRTSYEHSNNNFYTWNKDQLFTAAQDQTNPAVSQQAQKVLGFAAKMYKTDVNSLTPQQIYAASFINPDRPSSFEVPDFKYLNQQMKAEMFELSKKKANKAIEKLQKDINNTESEFGIKTAQKYVTLLKGLQEIGATSNEEWMKEFGPVFDAVGLPTDQSTLKNMWNGAIQNKLYEQYGEPTPASSDQLKIPYTPGSQQPGLLPKK